MATLEEQPVRNRRQVTLIVVASLALAVLIFLAWLFVLRTQMAPAFTNLKPADAALIVDELKRQKVPYRLADDGATILVPSDQVDAIRVAIVGGDLPLKGTVGFELFSKSDMGLTEFAQKINYQRALQGELARTLMSLGTIDSARVHITLPETGVFQEDHRPAKASVTITPKLGAVVDARAVMGIQRLAASAVENLDAANVVVLDGNGKQLSAEPTDAIFEPATTPAGGVEQAYATRVRALVAELITDPAMRVTVAMPRAVGTSGGAALHPIHIALAVTSSPPASLRERALALLQSAIAFDPAAGDSLDIVQLPAPSPYQVGAPIGSAAGAPIPGSWDVPAPSGLGLAWIGLALLLALVVGGILASPIGRTIIRRRRPEQFAARLRRLLDQEEAVGHG